MEAYYHGSRVASHPRLQKAQKEPFVQIEHMPQNHQKYLSRNEEEIRTWANGIGPHTTAVVEHFLTAGSEPEQGYKSCSTLQKLSDRYGHERLEKACGRVLCYTTDPAVRNISTILKNGQDRVEASDPAKTPNAVHRGGISRGPAYYRRGGDRNDQ